MENGAAVGAQLRIIGTRIARGPMNLKYILSFNYLINDIACSSFKPHIFGDIFC